jgi:hypothetical protein
MMPRTANEKHDSEVEQIQNALAARFGADAVTVRRYNPAAIRVRVIDARFGGKSIPQREKIALPVIRRLPDSIQSDITVLLLLAPDEQADSLMNLEFERPTRTRL